mmetsp:Transcript_72319/g.150882  ORF Transcript_72319/g.150882 Transcript_72319/m.150882 type:complete len:138 (-) Transcript_72319:1301-1714(-)
MQQPALGERTTQKKRTIYRKAEKHFKRVKLFSQDANNGAKRSQIAQSRPDYQKTSDVATLMLHHNSPTTTNTTNPTTTTTTMTTNAPPPPPPLTPRPQPRPLKMKLGISEGALNRGEARILWLVDGNVATSDHEQVL